MSLQVKTVFVLNWMIDGDTPWSEWQGSMEAGKGAILLSYLLYETLFKVLSSKDNIALTHWHE